MAITYDVSHPETVLDAAALAIAFLSAYAPVTSSIAELSSWRHCRGGATLFVDASMRAEPRRTPMGATMTSRDCFIPAGRVELPGALEFPDRPVGIVLFAHGSGSSRHSPRNRFVASVLHQAGIGTLLFDLLTIREADDRRNVFDIPLLADRLLAAVRWAKSDADAGPHPLGLFGASTGAAAALVAAAQEPVVRAVVSRGGRPDLAGDRLRDVRAPTLLIVGGEDTEVLALNQEALAQLTCTKELAVVPGATHLFEEPGTLERAALLAEAWFSRFLPLGTRP